MVIRCKNTKIFKRNDGSEFFLQSDGKDPSGVINHKYISIENHKMNGYTILSDDNLTNTPPAYDQGIANILLSKNRLQEKVQKFNGYVGYIGIENGRFVKYANIPVEERISGIKRY